MKTHVLALAMFLSLTLFASIGSSQCTYLAGAPLSGKATAERNNINGLIKQMNIDVANYIANVAAGPPAPTATPDFAAFKAKIDGLKLAADESIDEGTMAANPDFVRVDLPADTSLKLAVAADFDSGYLKSEDVLVFTVVDNVIVKDAAANWQCIAIPAGTKVFGVVDRAKGRTPFRIKGVARLDVFVKHVTAVDGSQIDITFTGPYGLNAAPALQAISAARKSNIVAPCRYDSRESCIHGRLNRTAISPSILGGAAQGTTFFSDDKTEKTIARLTLLQDISNASGLSDIINQSNAYLKANHTFEVRTRADTWLWVSTKPPDPPAKK